MIFFSHGNAVEKLQEKLKARVDSNTNSQQVRSTTVITYVAITNLL